MFFANHDQNNNKNTNFRAGHIINLNSFILEIPYIHVFTEKKNNKVSK